MRSGLCCPRPPLAPRTDVSGCSSWPAIPDEELPALRVPTTWETVRVTQDDTPSQEAWTGEVYVENGDMVDVVSPDGSVECFPREWLEAQGLFPTPTANDWKGASTYEQRRGQLASCLPGGTAAPAFLEWMMGLPKGWTKPSGTQVPQLHTPRYATASEPTTHSATTVSARWETPWSHYRLAWRSACLRIVSDWTSTAEVYA